jgi:hypothetical protein
VLSYWLFLRNAKYERKTMQHTRHLHYRGNNWIGNYIRSWRQIYIYLQAWSIMNRVNRKDQPQEILSQWQPRRNSAFTLYSPTIPLRTATKLNFLPQAKPNEATSPRLTQSLHQTSFPCESSNNGLEQSYVPPVGSYP